MYHLGEELDAVLAFQSFVHGPRQSDPCSSERALRAKRTPDALPSDKEVRVRVRVKQDAETGAYLRAD